MIFINSNDFYNGRIFSLIYELAHIWIGTNNLFNNNYFSSSVGRLEQLCNAITAEILVPIPCFEDEWIKSGGDAIGRIARLAEVFHCSELVIARRSLDLRFIDSNVYSFILSRTKDQFNTRHKSGKDSGNFYNILKSKWDKNFIKALDSSVKSGDTSYLDAYKMLRTVDKSS